MPNPLVSVLIPTYNQRDYIGQAVASALAQDYPNLEILVADDRSTDGTDGLVAEAIRDPRVVLIRNPSNLGRVANYRNALSRASGEWVINLDGDDYFTNASYIGKAVRLAQEHPDVALVFGRRYTDSDSALVVEARPGRNEGLPTVLEGNEVFLALADYSIVINHMTCLYRRDLAVALDFYRMDIISADWESIYRLVVGRRVGFLDEYCGAWRRHRMNASRAFREEEILDNYGLCESLYDFAAASKEFDPAVLSRWLDRFTENKLRRDCALAARFGSFGNLFRILARARSLSRRAFFSVAISRTMLRAVYRLMRRLPASLGGSSR